MSSEAMDSTGTLFARQLGEEIMKVLYINEGIMWQPSNGLWRMLPDYTKKTPAPGMHNLAIGIECVIGHNIDDIDACHKELVEMGADNPTRFSQYALQAVPAYFPNGYSHEGILAYCAMIAGVCRMCYGKLRNGVLDCAADVFHMVFTAFILTKEFDMNVFDQLVEVATFIMKQNEDIIANVVTPIEHFAGPLIYKCDPDVSA